MVSLSPQEEDGFLKDRYCVLEIFLSFLQRRHSWPSRLAYGGKTRPHLQMVLTDTTFFAHGLQNFSLRTELCLSLYYLLVGAQKRFEELKGRLGQHLLY